MPSFEEMQRKYSSDTIGQQLKEMSNMVMNETFSNSTTFRKGMIYDCNMQKIKENRLISFIIITAVYIVATIVGILTYKAINLSWWLALLIADIVATIVTFIFSLIFNNASVYDPYWSVQPPIILIAFAFGKKLTALGVLLIIAVCFWAIRLTANWAYTFKNLCHQDWRYTMLKETTGAFYPIINFVGIHLVPTLVVYGCIVPAVYAVVSGCMSPVTSNAVAGAIGGYRDIFFITSDASDIAYYKISGLFGDIWHKDSVFQLKSRGGELVILSFARRSFSVSIPRW